MATRAVRYANFMIVLIHHFPDIRDLVVQSQNMTCLTVRFHAYSLIQLMFQGLARGVDRAKYNLIWCD